ncbi:MAG: endonuclease domain-containing protein, partial [bacterium]
KSKELRKNSTDAENKLWNALKAKRFMGLKFRRQQQVGGYIADFYCTEKKLIIELDGGQHANSISDEKRDEFMESKGIRVLRIWNNEIMNNIEGVMEHIKTEVEKRDDSYRSFRKKRLAGQVRRG